MINLLYTELLKLKHTKMPWLVIVGALPANLVALYAFLPRVTPAGTRAGIDLQDLFYREGMMLVMMGPSIYVLFTAYILTREYSERTINQLFSYPVARVKILAAKLLVVFLLIAFTSLLSCTAVIAVSIWQAWKGVVDPDVLRMGASMNLTVCALSFGTVPLAAAVSLVGKNVIPAAVMGVFATIVTVIGEIGHGRGGILFPWLAPYWPVRELAQGIADNAGPNPYAVPAMIILSLTFVLPLIFCLAYWTRADVHSGT